MKTYFQCSRDQLTIRGLQFRQSSGVLPALILSHGFLANQKMCREYAELAATLGYAAFTYDFNGGGLLSKSVGKSEDMTILTEIEDLKAVIRYVATLENIDSKRITLLGCSQGGVVSAVTAGEWGNRIRSLILLYPAFCIPDDAKSGKMLFSRFDPLDIPPIIQRFPMKLSGEYARSIQNWTLHHMTGDYKNPVLLLHGTSDKIVDIAYARKAAANYSSIEYHEITGAGHMFRGRHDREARRLIRTFLEKHR